MLSGGEEDLPPARQRASLALIVGGEKEDGSRREKEEGEGGEESRLSPY